MRIVAGAWRGRTLAAPAGAGTRPTRDRAREGLFSMLHSRLGSFQGLEVADLFAGTGALGLEALSRGAAFCTFVEKDRAALDVLRANVGRLSAAGRADVRPGSVEYCPPPPRPCDLVLMDPPYRSGLAQSALDRLVEPGWLAPGAWVSVETEREELRPPAILEPQAERRFGKAKILLLRASA